MRLSSVLYIVLVVIMLTICMLNNKYTGNYLTPWLIIPATLLGAVYMLSPQIDFWLNKKISTKLDEKVVLIFTTFSPFYSSLSKEKKQLFNHRINLFIDSKDWIYKGEEKDMPFDIKAIISFEAIRLTLNYSEFLFKSFSRMVVYPYPFLSLQFPNSYHASEIHLEDGVAIFSLKNIMPAFREPLKYFNVVLYEFAKIFKLHYSELALPIVPDHFWLHLPNVAYYGLSEIQNAVGIFEIDDWSVAVHHYFVYSEHFKAIYPEFGQEFDHLFNYYHLNS